MKTTRSGRLIAVAVIAVTSLGLMAAAGGCGSDLHKAVVAADTIGSTLSAAATVNHSVLANGQESAAENLAIATFIDKAAKANDAFVAQLDAAEQTNGQVTAASIVSALSTLTSSIQALQQQGVLGLKSASAQAAFNGIVTALEAQLSVLQALVQANTSQNIPLRKSAPLAALTLSATEIEELIGIVTAALGPTASLVEKLIGLKSETDAQILADASAQDEAAEKQAEDDEASDEATEGKEGTE